MQIPRNPLVPGAASSNHPRRMDSKKLALLCRDLAENKKAENVVVLDVRKLSDVTDFFVIASASSEPHLRAIETEILATLLNEHELKPHATDGQGQATWIVADYFDVIVHIMRPEVRDHYDLEGLWSDAPRLPRPRRTKASAASATSE